MSYSKSILRKSLESKLADNEQEFLNALRFATGEEARVLVKKHTEIYKELTLKIQSLPR